MIKKIKSTDFERILRVALYLRLSKEDLDKLTPEERSESIKNQEIMLRAYAEDNGWKIGCLITSKGYAGSKDPEFEILENTSKAIYNLIASVLSNMLLQ